MSNAPAGETWDDIYSRRQPTKYPYDAVVTFVMRHAPHGHPRHDVRILEVGCGGGNNLWFAAREGFQVWGIDAAAAAIEFARQRFRDEGLNGEFHHGTFEALPYPDGFFDLVIDRGGLTCVAPPVLATCLGEVNRVLKPAGRFFFSPYSTATTSLAGYGKIYFYDEPGVTTVLSGWEVISQEHVVVADSLSGSVRAEWRVIAKKWHQN